VLSEQVKIETPEQIALELPVAGIGSRFLALAIDTVFQVVAYFLALVVFAFFGTLFAGSFHLSDAWASLGPAIFVLATFCLYWGYFAAFEILWKGQTPGKRSAHIRVIKISGRPIDPASAVIRNLLRVVDFLPGMYGAGVVCMLLNRNSRRIGDFVAGTVVIHDRADTDSATDWQTPRESKTPPTSGARLTDDEVVLIETYLARRFNLPTDVREQTGNRIVKRIVDRTGTAPEPNEYGDDFLDRMVRSARDAGGFRNTKRD